MTGLRRSLKIWWHTSWGASRMARGWSSALISSRLCACTTRFKNPDDPFRLVFVCAMWMTGFDAPAVSTIYLDKPMRNHTLMQTIARANRVFEDKNNGLIVDYVGVFRNLEKALAIYGAASDRDESPIEIIDA